MRYVAALAVLVISVAMVPHSASAHFLDTDGTVGSILHVAPDDDPVVGQPAEIHFELKDKAGKFSATACDCVVEISRDGAVEQSLQAAVGNDFEGTRYENGVDVTYTFPSAGVYELKLTGRPTVSGSFSDFTITHDLRVTRTATSGGTGPSWVPLIVAAGVILFVLGLIGFFAARRTSAKSKQ